MKRSESWEVEEVSGHDWPCKLYQRLRTEILRAEEAIVDFQVRARRQRPGGSLFICF